jgi:subtilisin family serine protease
MSGACPAEDWNLEAVSAREAWKKVDDASRVIVAIVDSGVYRSHPAFAGNVWANTGEEPDGRDNDENIIGHGTRVASIVGANDKDRPTVRGIAPKVKLMPVKIAKDGFSEEVDFSCATRAIDHAVRHGATILNLSWSSSEPSAALRRCIDRIARDNPEVLFVASPGNCEGGNCCIDIGEAPRFPASFGSPNMIVVTSTTATDRLGTVSPTSAELVDLAAPGYQITTATTPDVPGGYGMRTGTSFAAPHVSGAAALLKALHPGWDFAQLKGHLLASVDKLPHLQGKVTSAGRLNVARAVTGPIENVSIDSGSVWKSGHVQTIRWDNAYRTPASATVDIKWSNDAGASFPLALISGVRNSGEVRINVPAGATSRGRIRVQCCDTQFFADSKELISTRD